MKCKTTIPKRVGISLTGMLLLSGCADCRSLPAPHDWSVAEQKQIAKEHNALPASDPLRGVLDEWQDLRAAAKTQ